jgi:hypothetical protein
MPDEYDHEIKKPKNVQFLMKYGILLPHRLATEKNFYGSKVVSS